MSGEKKSWRLSTSFQRGFFGKQDPQPKTKARHSGNRISSVYLSDGSSTSSFVVIPEFDDPVRMQTLHDEPSRTSYLSELPIVSSPLSTDGVDGYLCWPQPTASQHCSYPAADSRDRPAVNTNWDDDLDLTRRLDYAYEYIRSMPSPVSPTFSLSSDPQMLRKQLGVPQHSVLNYPIDSSPELPNPHPFPRELTSPILPHARTSKFGLRINTAADLPSRHRRLPNPFQPTTQRKSMEIAPSTIENSPARCCTLETTWSAHITCASNAQPHTPNQSKLSECRAEEPVHPLPSSPSSRRQASRGVLRKYTADTPPSSANAYKWQTSLPLIRPPSPFRVDIPLHHTWHDRRTNFNSSSECHSKADQRHDTTTQRASGSTEFLASLAWIGTPPMTLNPSTTDRKHHLTSPAFSPDHFSMAIAVEDDSISDDILIDRLEKVRRIGGERRTIFSHSRSLDNAHVSNVHENGLCDTSFTLSSPSTSDKSTKLYDAPLLSPLASKGATPDSEDTAVWRAARKTLLCIREIIRTEKKYQEALKTLLNAQTATPPPPSMTPYISALVRASEMLLKSFLEDPSAWGVSTAFVTSEDELEATMVSWCAVAGVFFTDGSDPQSSRVTGKWRLRKTGVTSSSSSCETKPSSISLSPQLPPMFAIISSTGKMEENGDDGYHTGRHLQSESVRRRMSVPKLGRSNSQSSSGQPPSRRPSVRDLAIQPIQRIMRYVLLYRDLLDCTPPTSPSRLLVERALEAATRIASHCDGAQRNPAFYRAT